MTRLGQNAYIPAIANDVAAGSVEKKALAEEIDAVDHRDLPPYAVYVARTNFMHTLAFNDPLKGISPDQLRYSVLGPATDISFIEEARKKFIAESAYLDDRPGAPMLFLAEANLRQIIRREERHVDAGEVRSELNDRIREIFSGRTFETVTFPGGPFDVPDEVANGQPKLIVLSYDGLAMEEAPDSFTAEGILKEALLRLWELARARKVESIGVLTIRMFEAGDAFRLFGAVGAVSGADKMITITGGYETRDGGLFELDFRGPVSDAQPVREFLEPQLRAASSGSIEAGFELTFSQGLSMQGEAAEKLSECLARFASGAAHVSGTAEVKA